MNLRNTREIKDFASRRLEESASQKQIVTIYIGLALGLTALVTVLNHVLGLQIDNFGGLSNLGKRTMLSSIQSMLPLAQSILAMCLDVGYVAAMLPCFAFGGVVLVILGGPIFYSFRMVNYVIIDKPAMGALMALRESKKMMRGHRLQLLKLDVSLWWYYLASAGALLVCYGDVLLPMLGVELPVPETVAFFGFYLLYMAASFCVHYFLRNKAEVSYALAYDAVKPEEKQSGGVVLGNIFQM